MQAVAVGEQESGRDWEHCQVRVCYVSYNAMGNFQVFTQILKVRGSFAANLSSLQLFG